MTEGKLDNIGFLLFLDGKPQAYKVNDTGTEYEYLHCFQTSDKHQEKFSFVFTPITGTKGDTLNITIISITNPNFQPDMKETSSYGWYHKPLERVLKLHFNEDAPDSATIFMEKVKIFFLMSALQKKKSRTLLLRMSLQRMVGMTLQWIPWMWAFTRLFRMMVNSCMTI